MQVTDKKSANSESRSVSKLIFLNVKQKHFAEDKSSENVRWASAAVRSLECSTEVIILINLIKQFPLVRERAINRFIYARS